MSDKLKLVQNQQASQQGGITQVKPLKIRTIKHARRLLSRLIYQLQTGEIQSQEAKDLTYLLVSYCNIVKDFELQERLDTLEQKLSEKESDEKH